MHGILFELQGRQLGQELVGQPRSRPAAPAPRPVDVRHEQLVELLADPLRRHDLQAVRASARSPRRTRGAGVTPSCATNRAARSIRSGSSRERRPRARAACRVASRAEVLHTLEGVDELAVGQPDRHRVDREVAAGEIGLDVLRERDRGLRSSSGYTLLPEGRDLDQGAVPSRPHGPEPHAHEVLGLRPALEEPRRLGGRGVGGEVAVGRRRRPDHEVADHAADQIQLVPGGLEAVAELLRERSHLERGHDVRTIAQDPADRRAVP